MVGQLQERINKEVPNTHAAMAWLADHAAEVISKHLVGKDGRTPYERLLGRKLREDAIEFGERVYYRKRSTAYEELDTRWAEGIWVGKRWGTMSCI
eukprot:3594214-Lingulodinium_polyedra.AAC.1